MSSVVLSRDPLMVSFKPEESRSRTFRIRGSRAIPNWVMTSSRPFLRTQLEMWRSVLLECVVGPVVREQWRQLAEGAGARFWIIDTICSDPDLHRQLIQGRGATQRGDWVRQQAADRESQGGTASQANTPPPSAGASWASSWFAPFSRSAMSFIPKAPCGDSAARVVP
jgi:hypothetical protein